MEAKKRKASPVEIEEALRNVNWVYRAASSREDLVDRTRLRPEDVAKRILAYVGQSSSALWPVLQELGITEESKYSRHGWRLKDGELLYDAILSQRGTSSYETIRKLARDNILYWAWDDSYEAADAGLAKLDKSITPRTERVATRTGTQVQCNVQRSGEIRVQVEGFESAAFYLTTSVLYFSGQKMVLSDTRRDAPMPVSLQSQLENVQRFIRYLDSGGVLANTDSFVCHRFPDKVELTEKYGNWDGDGGYTETFGPKTTISVQDFRAIAVAVEACIQRCIDHQ